MLTLMFILVPTLMYLMVGAKVARSRYALQKFEYQTALPAWEKKKSKVRHYDVVAYSRNHGAGCNLRYSSFKKDGCDCTYRGEWEVAMALKSEKPPMPEAPYLTMVTWPWAFLNDYLTGGTVSKPNYLVIEELEKKLEIGK